MPKTHNQEAPEELALGGSWRGDLGGIGGEDDGGFKGGGEEKRRKTTTAGMERPAENGGGDRTRVFTSTDVDFFDLLIIGIEIAYHLPYIEYRSNYVMKFLICCLLSFYNYNVYAKMVKQRPT